VQLPHVVLPLIQYLTCFFVLFYSPDYRETALYGRKWINRLVLQLASIKEIAEAPSDADPKSNRFTQAQKLVVELTEGVLLSFVQKEEAASQYNHSALEDAIYKRYTALVHELLSGYGNMDSVYLQKMPWISPVLLSSCIRSKNEDIRLMVQKLVSRTSADATPAAPYPAPSPPKPKTSEAQDETAAEPENVASSQENGAEADKVASPTADELAAASNGTAEEAAAS